MSRFFTILVLVTASFLAAGCSKKGKNLWAPDLKVKREVLRNGLTVLYVEDHTVPVVSYSTWFRVGSAWEKKGKTGIAHLFEHMMFKGTPKYPAKEFFKRLESKGAVVNAFTQREVTVYYEVISSEFLELVMDMESDRLANFQISQKDLDSERQVVKEERRLRVDSNFSALQMEALLAKAFPTHPYGWPVIGTPEDLDGVTVEDCREFFSKYYQPANAIITIAGDFDQKKTSELIKKYYGKIEGKKVAPLQLPEAKPLGIEKKIDLEKPVKAESILIGYRIPNLYHPDAEKLAMLAWALFEMNSSRANLALVREKKVALNVGADASLEKMPFLFLVSVDLKSGISAESGLGEIDAVIEDAKNIPFSNEEVDRVKNRLIYSTVNEAKSPIGIASWLASGEFLWNDYKHVYKVLERYHSLKPEDLAEVARKYLKKENRTVVFLKPERAKTGAHAR